MRALINYLSTAVSALMQIADELKRIREILDSTAYPDMAVTAKQAAIMLNVNESKINSMLRRGELHRRLIGGKRGISQQEIKKLQ